MIKNTNINNVRVYDGLSGEFEIIFSESFNIYNNCLRIDNLYGYGFVFNFKKDINTVTGKADNEKKIVNIDFPNNNNNFGAISNDITHVMTATSASDGIDYEIYYSLYIKSFSDELNALNVVLTFYKKNIINNS